MHLCGSQTYSIQPKRTANNTVSHNAINLALIIRLKVKYVISGCNFTKYVDIFIAMDCLLYYRVQSLKSSVQRKAVTFHKNPDEECTTVRRHISNSIIEYKSSMFFHLIAFTYAASFNTPDKLLSQSAPKGNTLECSAFRLTLPSTFNV